METQVQAGSGFRKMGVAAKIETTANLSTIVVALLILAVLFKAYLLPNMMHRVAAASAPAALGSSLDGRALGVNWKTNRHTLVLAISTICHYCKDSIPFYRTLGAKIANVKMVAVLPQTASEGEKYLAENGVRIDQIRQVAALNTVGVTATPTLLLVDGSGVVTHVWVGQLRPEQETEVLTALEKAGG